MSSGRSPGTESRQLPGGDGLREASAGAVACGTDLAMHILYTGIERYLKINLFTDIIKL